LELDRRWSRAAGVGITLLGPTARLHQLQGRIAAYGLLLAAPVPAGAIALISQSA